MDHLGSLMLGPGNGGVFAALAIALVLTYRSSGVINFATGAIALHGTYTFSSLPEGEVCDSQTDSHIRMRIRAQPGWRRDTR